MAGKWLFSKRTFFLFKQTDKPATAGEVVKAVDAAGNAEYTSIPDVAANVEEIADPASATAEDCAEKINEIIAALIAAGIMDAGVS